MAKDSDIDNDGIRDGLDNDMDGDGLENLSEYNLGTDWDKPDTDGDGINDLNEFKWRTNPKDADTDDDGYDDLRELQLERDPTRWEAGADRDRDRDGLSDVEEIWQGTDPDKDDTDGDELIDSFEVKNRKLGFDPLTPDRPGGRRDGTDADADQGQHDNFGGWTHGIDAMNLNSDGGLYVDEGGLAPPDATTTFGGSAAPFGPSDESSGQPTISPAEKEFDPAAVNVPFPPGDYDEEQTYEPDVGDPYAPLSPADTSSGPVVEPYEEEVPWEPEVSDPSFEGTASDQPYE